MNRNIDFKVINEKGEFEQGVGNLWSVYFILEWIFCLHDFRKERKGSLC